MLVGNPHEDLGEDPGSWTHVNFTMKKKLVWHTLTIPVLIFHPHQEDYLAYLAVGSPRSLAGHDRLLTSTYDGVKKSHEQGPLSTAILGMVTQEIMIYLDIDR